jgi:hypothetical protein
MITWVLFLNDMRSRKIEILEPVVRGESKEQLLDFLSKNTVEVYKEEGANTFYDNYIFSKSFTKGSLLEWYNQPYPFEEHKNFKCFDTDAMRRFGEDEEAILSLEAALKNLPTV